MVILPVSYQRLKNFVVKADLLGHFSELFEQSLPCVHYHNTNPPPNQCTALQCNELHANIVMYKYFYYEQSAVSNAVIPRHYKHGQQYVSKESESGFLFD